MAAGVLALKTAKVIDWGSVRKAIGVARGDVKGIKDAQAVLQIRHRFCQGRRRVSGQVAEGPTQTMPPDLLAQMQVEGLEGLLHRLMGSEAGPFVVTSVSAHPCLIQVGLGLMQPVSGAVHAAIVICSTTSARHQPTGVRDDGALG